MNRAAVLIGVEQSGRLPQLRAVQDGIRRTREWALGQGIPDDSIKVLSDEGGKVYSHEIFNAVRELAGFGAAGPRVRPTGARQPNRRGSGPTPVRGRSPCGRGSDHRFAPT